MGARRLSFGAGHLLGQPVFVVRLRRRSYRSGRLQRVAAGRVERHLRKLEFRLHRVLNRIQLVAQSHALVGLVLSVYGWRAHN